MSTFEKLGIEIEIVQGSAFKRTLENIAETLNKAVKIEGFQKLLDVLQRFETGSAQNQTDKLSDRLENLRSALKKTEEEFKALQNAAGANNYYTKAAKDIEALRGETNQLALAERAVREAREKAADASYRVNKRIQDQEVEMWRTRRQQVGASGLTSATEKESQISTAYRQKMTQDKELLTQELSFARQRAAMYAADEKLKEQRLNKLASLQKKEEAITAAKERDDRRELESMLRKIDAQKRADYLAEQTFGGSTVAAYRNSGMQQVNGGWVRSSVNTNQSINEAHAAALKLAPQYDVMIAKSKEWESYMKSLHTQGKAMWNAELVSLQEYNRRLRLANGEVDGFHLTLGRMFKGLVEFYGIRAVLFAVSNQVKTAISDILQFNQALHDTAAISNASSESMLNIGEAALEIARTSRMTLPEVMKLQNLLAQSGVESKNVPFVSKVAAMFATATGSSPENAVRVLTTAMNVWKIEAEDAARVSNVFAASLNASKLEVQDLSTVFNYLAAVASQVGMSLEETSGYVAALSQAGLKASTIGTSMSEMLSKLMAPTPKIRKMWKELGVEVDELNPRLHSLADIIERIGRANVPIEQLYSSFGPRAGRALEGFLTIGPDYMRMMEANVSGSGAAFSGYMRVMEGAGAKMNVLRQTFVQALLDIGENFSRVFSGMYDIMLTFVDGMRTSGGRIVLVVGTIAAALVALSAVAKSTGVLLQRFALIAPELKVLALVAVGVVSAIQLIGSSAERSFTGVRQALEGLGEDLSQNQRNFTMLSDLYMKAAEKHQLKVKLDDVAKSKLQALKAEYPALFENLDIERMKYEDISKVMKNVNDQRYLFAKDRLPAMQEAAELAYAAGIDFEPKIAKLKAAIKKTKEGDVPWDFGYGISPLYDNQQTVLKKLNLMLLKTLAEQKKAQGDAGIEYQQAITGGMYKIVGTTESGAPALDAIKPTNTKPERSGKKGWEPSDPKAEAAAQAAAMRVAKNDNSFKYWLAQDGARAAIEEVKLDKDEQERILKDKTKNFEDRQEALKNIYKLNYALFYEERTKKIEELNKVFAEKNGMLFDAEDKVYRNPKKIGKDGRGEVITVEDPLWKKAVDSLNVDRRDKQSVLYTIDMFKKTNAADAKADSELKLTDKETLRSDYLEKQADRKLHLETQALDIEKQFARTADEVAAIEVRRTEASIEANREKKAAYEDDIRKLTDIIDKTKLHDSAWADANTRLELYKEKLEDVNILLGAEKNKLDEQKNTKFWHNFKEGARQANVALGDIKTNTATLGRELTGGLFSGISNGLNNMVQALASGKNAWQGLRQATTTMLQEMSKSVTDYVAKMLIELFKLYVMQKLLGAIPGLFAPGAAGANVAAGANYSGIPTMNGVTVEIATGGLITKNGVQRFDIGGVVPYGLGIRGKDSVPALLMPGEFVVREDAVNHFGLEFFRKINAKRLAEGGLVGSARPAGYTSTPSKLDGENGEVTLNIINVVDSRSIPKTTGAEILNVINYEVAKEGPTYKQLKAKIVGR